MSNLLFICSQNRLRSPTAEAIFSVYEGIYTASAGISSGADSPVTPELLKWADVVLVMEHIHKTKLTAKHLKHLRNKKVVVLGIPDNYDYMDPSLVEILTNKVERLLPNLRRPLQSTISPIEQ